MITKLLFVLLFILPVAEIIVFTLVGVHWGWLEAILLTLVTSCLGVSLSRYHQYRARGNLEQALSGNLPDGSILDSMLTYLGCFLLILPGFITDAVGLFLLIPLGRTLITRFFGRRLTAGPTSEYASPFSQFTFFSRGLSAGSAPDADSTFHNHEESRHSDSGVADDIIDVEFEVKD